MSNWQSNKIPTNGITLHYTRTGSNMGGDKPPIVLAHGFSDDGLCWTPVAQALEADYDVIMVDARGHGRSDAPDGGYQAQTMATDLAGVITALGLTKPVVMGHSMGGATTMALAGLFPEIPGAIIIEDAAAGNIMADKSPEALARLQGWHDRMVMLQSKTHAELIEHAHTVTPTWAEPELEPWAHAKLRFNMKALDRSDAVPLDWAELLGNITCPALLLYADPDRGGGVTAERAAEMQGMLPQLQTVHIAGAGHNIRREQFDAYMDAVSTFLAKIMKSA